jgi:Uma2 family endonuclease
MMNDPCYRPDMRSKARPTDLGPFRAEHLRSGDPYELSDGHPIYCAPTGGRGSDPNRLGASVVGWDPNVKEAGVDTGYSLKPGTLRAPDVAVGNVPDKPGWVPGAPELAIEYADVGQDEAGLQKKIADLLAAGTKFLWVVRLTGLRRVEVYEPRKKMRTVHPGRSLSAPGVLKNPVRVEALYDRDEAERATLTNLLQRRGYQDFDAVLAEGREQGLIEGREQGLTEGREQGREQGLLVGKRDALKRVLERRGLGMTKSIEATIEACADAHKLDRWLDRALGASSAAAVFKPRSR